MVAVVSVALTAILSLRAPGAGKGPTRFLTEPTGGGVLVCRITSATSEPRRVRVEALDPDGVATSDSGPFRLEGGATYLSSGGVDARRCRFTVDGNPVGLRAHGLVMTPQGEARSLPPRPSR